MPKTIEVVGVKLMAIQIAEGRRQVQTQQGVQPGESVGNVVVVTYGLLEKTEKDKPESIVKASRFEALEKDLSPATKKALRSFVDSLKADIQKNEGM